MDTIFRIVLSLGEHRGLCTVSRYDFFMWLDNLRSEFKIYNTYDVACYDNRVHHSDYFILNYHGHLEKIGEIVSFSEHEEKEELPFT